MKEPGQPRVTRLSSFSPLRYPGGKGKLAPFVKQLIENNGLSDGAYVEPYAGGAAVACELLLQDYVSRIYINDINRAVWAFWWSILNDTESLLRRIRDVRLTVASWDRKKRIFSHPEDHGASELGFATFFLNRTNRSGIFNGGIIGGRDQTGPWKIGARFPRTQLAARISAIASMRSRIVLSNQDAKSFLIAGFESWPAKTLIYMDPPYYVKGKALYLNFYQDQDHRDIAALLTEQSHRQRWIVSYDNTPEIRAMYQQSRSLEYSLLYTARGVRSGREIMFFCESLKIPPMGNGRIHPLSREELSQLDKTEKLFGKKSR
jgi:DNA adenine methylase